MSTQGSLLFILFLLLVGAILGFVYPGDGRWYGFGEKKELRQHSVLDHVEFGFIEQDARDAYRNLVMANARAINRLRAAGTEVEVEKMQNIIEASIGVMNKLTTALNNVHSEYDYEQVLSSPMDIVRDYITT